MLFGDGRAPSIQIQLDSTERIHTVNEIIVPSPAYEQAHESFPPRCEPAS